MSLSVADELAIIRLLNKYSHRLDPADAEGWAALFTDWCYPASPSRSQRVIIHQRQRARERVAVTAYRRDAKPETVTPDLLGQYGSQINQMVWDRRARDKVGPLIRWAEATIACWPAARDLVAVLAATGQPPAGCGG